MLSQDEIEKLEREFESAKDRLREAEKHGKAQDKHALYSKAYQNLVKAGLREQIKRKYRDKGTCPTLQRTFK